MTRFFIRTRVTTNVVLLVLMGVWRSAGAMPATDASEPEPPVSPSKHSNSSTVQLRVTIYDAARMRGSERETAFSEVRRIVRSAGIETIFFDGDLANPEAS